ncbi:MAG: hypothetical protein GX259_06315 [Bacteroidales bacterium]|nr:hypothetical protein [Bacteroidales bacterium]
MMKSISLLGLSLILLISILTSCDPAISYEYNLNNKSDKELKVYYKGLGFNNKSNSMTVLPKTKIQLFETEIWGSNPHDEKDNFLQMFDTLSITAADSSKLLLDYFKRDNWSYSNDIGHLGFIKVGTNIYDLEVTNEDFEIQ